jgi:RecB family exonuclease
MTAPYELEFDAESHVYKVDGVPVPSVTQLLAPVKPDFSMVPPDVLERKRQLGAAVHLACELDDDDELEECDPAVQPYVDAWRKFKADTGAEVLMNEQQLYSQRLRFAGTLDRVVRVRSGDVYLIDLKTSIAMPASYGVQLAGYQLLLYEQPPILTLSRKGLRLSDDGTYKLVPFDNPNDLQAFMACLALHNWKNSTK